MSARRWQVTGDRAPPPTNRTGSEVLTFRSWQSQHPFQVEAGALQHGADELCFPRLQADIEEHAGGAGVLKGAAVAVEPGGEEHAAGAGGHILHRLGHVVVETAVYRLLTVGHIPVSPDRCRSHPMPGGPSPTPDTCRRFPSRRSSGNARSGRRQWRRSWRKRPPAAGPSPWTPSRRCRSRCGCLPTAVAPAPTPIRDASPPPPNTGVPGARPSSAAAWSVSPPTSSAASASRGRCSGCTPNIRQRAPLQHWRPGRVS